MKVLIIVLLNEKLNYFTTKGTKNGQEGILFERGSRGNPGYFTSKFPSKQPEKKD